MKKETIITIVGAIVAIALLWLLLGGELPKGPLAKKVVVYVSEDRLVAEPILRDFERETGISVEAVYDTQKTKGTGIVNRLTSEKNNPRADVYWAIDPIRAEVLKQMGVSAFYHSKNWEGIPSQFKDPEGYWCGFSARARLFLVNRGVENPPASILDYTNPVWKGRAVIANPLFGTTTAHMAALFTLWGDERAEAFMRAMHKNGVAVSTSNGESADLVAMDYFDFALVDSDHAIRRIRQGKPVKMAYPDQKKGGLGCFIVPSAAVLINGAPHPEAAKRLIDYLLSKETERKLALADCALIPLHKGVPIPKELTPIEEIQVMKVDYAKAAKKLVQIQPFLRQWASL